MPGAGTIPGAGALGGGGLLPGVGGVPGGIGNFLYIGKIYQIYLAGSLPENKDSSLWATMMSIKLRQIKLRSIYLPEAYSLPDIISQ